MSVTTQVFKGLLKSSNNVKFSSDAEVLHLTHEAIANLASTSEFDKKSIQCFPNIFKNSTHAIDACASNNVGAEAAVSGANTSYISVTRLITAVNAAKCHGSIEKFMNPHNISYSIVLATSKVEHEVCLSVKDEAKCNAPKINDRDNDHKVISCFLIIKNFLMISYFSRFPLSCFICEDTMFPDEIVCSLLTNCYCGKVEA